MIEINNFLSDYNSFRLHCDGLDYEGTTNPFDGVFYPGVSTDIPESIKLEVIEKLEFIEEKKINVKAIFLRMSALDTEAPHQAHTDSLMGLRSFMLYMTRDEFCEGGTALVVHESGMDENPYNEHELSIWERDTNKSEMWETTKLCEMEENKACLFESRLMHRAEPIGGFGDNPVNSRLVLTVFYDN